MTTSSAERAQHYDKAFFEGFADFGAVLFLHFGQVGGFAFGGLAPALEHGEL
jgi:hypothetical protein